MAGRELQATLLPILANVRRKEAMESERTWDNERVVFARALRHSHNIRRLGFVKLDYGRVYT